MSVGGFSVAPQLVHRLVQGNPTLGTPLIGSGKTHFGDSSSVFGIL